MKEFTLIPTGTIEAYINNAYQIPVLNAEEEKLLAIQLRDHQNLEAAKQLILSHLRFVIRIARGYLGYGLPLSDLIQEGTIGLMKAVRRFEPEMGVRLVSFAVHWIRAEIHEYILRNWRIVKIATTKAQRKLFFNLRSCKQRLGWFTKQEIEKVAVDLGVKPETVLQMESRLINQDLSFDTLEDNEEDNSNIPANYLPDFSTEPSRLIEQEDFQYKQREQLYQAINNLDERSKTILKERWLSEKKKTLHQLSGQFGISAERVRQIEQKALNTLKLQLTI